MNAGCATSLRQRLQREPQLVSHLRIAQIHIEHPRALLDAGSQCVTMHLQAAYSDDHLIDAAWAYEQATRRREPAFLTPTLPSDQIEVGTTSRTPASAADVVPEVSISRHARFWQVEVRLPADTDAQVWADGHLLRPVTDGEGTYRGTISVHRPRLDDQVMIVVKAGHASASLTFKALPTQDR